MCIGLLSVNLLDNQYSKFGFCGENMKNLEELKAKAEAGDPDAAYEYADELRETFPEGSDNHPEYSTVARYLGIAANAGHLNACFDLGHLYRLGTGVKHDYAKALEFFRQGAEQESASCMHEVAMFYSSGWGVEEDILESTRWLKRAADRGHSSSAMFLGASPFCDYVDKI